MKEFIKNCKSSGLWLLANGHKYLQAYCIAEIIALIALGFAFQQQMQFMYDHIMQMQEWQLLGFAPFPTATWLMIKDIWNSINSETRDLKVD